MKEEAAIAVRSPGTSGPVALRGAGCLGGSVLGDPTGRGPGPASPVGATSAPSTAVQQSMNALAHRSA